MIEALLDLPAPLRERLSRALDTGLVSAPYAPAALRSALGISDVNGVRDALEQCAARGMEGAAVATALSMVDQAVAQIDRPDLVWSGPEVPGLHARDTRRVYDEFVAAAERSIWLCTYAYYDGQKAFKSLAKRLDTTPSLKATLLLNIQRKHGDTTTAEQLIVKFAERFRNKDWPGKRQPEVYYDPRSLDLEGEGTVLHAKAIVVDDETAFVTSANMTEAAFDRNIEAGILSRDRMVAASLSKHFRVLIERQLLLPLP